MVRGNRKSARIGLAARAKLRQFLARAKQVLTTEPNDAVSDAGEETAAQEVGLAGAKLGGGDAKVAQLLGYFDAPSTTDARAALASLWDNAPTMSAADAQRVVRQELGCPADEAYTAWTDEPFAAASIGQVHQATGIDGVEYAVKVQYPYIADMLRDDLESVALVKRLVGSDMARGLDEHAVATVRAAVLSELDYEQEAAALVRFGVAYAGDTEIVIPEVAAERSTGRVLTMGYMRGRSLTDVAADSAQQLRDRVGRIIFRFAWGAPLEHGLVQADPNPGNYLVLSSAAQTQVAFLDYGCTAVLDDEVVALERKLWRALMHREPMEAADRFRRLLLELGMVPSPRAFHSELCREWERLVVAPFQRDNFSWTSDYAADLISHTTGMIRSGKLRLPASLVLLWRQRLGVAAVLGMLRPTANFRGALSAMLAS